MKVEGGWDELEVLLNYGDQRKAANKFVSDEKLWKEEK